MAKINKQATVFVSGKVSGIPYLEACRKFYDAAGMLLKHGYTPIVPVDLCHSWWGWYRCMAVCLFNLAKCRYFYQLDNWQDSKGARVEYIAARLLRKKFIKL